MKGFFKKEELNPLKKHITSRVMSCKDCGLYKNVISPRMPYGGKGRKNILALGEAPGREEDRKGEQFVGDTGNLLEEKFKSLGINLHVDLYKDNACRCRPMSKTGANRTPTNTEIKICRVNTFTNIKKIKPEKIILLGKSAVNSVIGHKTSVTSIGKWIGFPIPDQELKTWLFPTYHPAFLLRDRDNKVLNLIFSNHLKQAIEWDKKFVEEKPEAGITLLKSTEDILSYLSSVKQNKPKIAFDYETTGLKPHKAGHEIVCMSVSSEKNKAMAFPFLKDHITFLRRVKEILTNPDIKKTAHNVRYEDSWTRFILGYDVKGWDFDTMLAAHILDNREGITGLKFQIYINYGILGYDKEVEPFLKSGSKDNNAFNRVKKCPINKLLLYCGIDSKYTYRLEADQKEKFTPNFRRAYNLFHRGALELSRVESNGININTDYYEKHSKHLQTRIDRIEKKILEMEEAEKWRESKKTELNLNSGPQLRELLYDILKYKSSKETTRGNKSTDKTVLEAIGTPFTKKLIEYNRLYQIRNTFLAGFIRETVEGILRPNFPLNFVSTYRGSSKNPNFQNNPKRNEESQRITRTGIIPRPGNLLLEADFKGIEVSIAACYHRDPEMIRYLNDKKSDLHRDQAMTTFFLEKEQVTPIIRYIAKNKEVFPFFYGSYYAQCAPNLWESIQGEKTTNDILVTDILTENGIRSYNQFEGHIRRIEDKFWNKKFRVYKKWKEDFYESYLEKGYVDYLTGFRVSGLMKKNEVVNYPIQGSAFHCLLWTLIQLGKELRKNKFKSLIIGQIHDSIVMDVVPEELKDIVTILRRLVREELRKYWKWIIVPMEIEIEISDIDGNWYKKKEYTEE